MSVDSIPIGPTIPRQKSSSDSGSEWSGSRSHSTFGVNATADLLEQLCDELASGSATIGNLLELARPRLLRLIEVRMSNLLCRRVDPEDVLQETMVVATKRYGEFLGQRKVPVFVWLRGLALERLVEANRRHLGAAKRAMNREAPPDHWLDQSGLDLSQRWAVDSETPSRVITNRQRGLEIRTALDQLPSRYRDVIVLRFFESLTVAETAAAMQITESNAKVMQLRAIKKLEQIMTDSLGWKSADRTV